MRTRAKKMYYNRAYYLPYDKINSALGEIPREFRFMYKDNLVDKQVIDPILLTTIATDSTSILVTDSMIDFQRNDKILFNLSKDANGKYTSYSEIIDIELREDTSLLQSAYRKRKNRFIKVITIS